MFLVFLSAIGLICIVLAMLSLKPEFRHAIEKMGKSKDFTYRKTKGEYIAYTLIACIFAGWGIVYYNGFYALLWFLPESWGGYDGIGNWTSTRSRISGAAATFLTLFTLNYEQKAYDMYLRIKRDENKEKDKSSTTY